MKKDSNSNEDLSPWDMSVMPRSVTPSWSYGGVVTPLPQIKGKPLTPLPNAVTAKSGKSALSMLEVQHMAKLKEKDLHRSSLHCSSSELHVPSPPKHAREMHQSHAVVKKRHGKKKKKDEAAEILKAEAMIAEVSRGRAMFNRNSGTLPEIGQTSTGLSRSSVKLPKIEEARIENHVIDVINRHEPDVLARSTLKEISQDFMSYSAKSFSVPHSNTAPEVILKNEARVGTAYSGLPYDEYANIFGNERPVSRSRGGSRGSRKSN